MSKSGKSAYFRHIFANNFFVTFFSPFFVRLALKFEKSTNLTLIFFLNKKGIKNAEFHADFKSIGKVFKKCKKIFFLNFESKCAQDGSK
jgi:hypothetical protein